MIGSNVIAEIRVILSREPTTNGWWKLIDLLESTDRSEHELARDYIVEHLSRIKGWRMAAIPCGEWPRSSEGWSLSSVVSELVSVFENVKAVWCPAGSFLMGACDNDKEAYEDEMPQHKVKFSRGFWIWDAPVTQRQFEFVMGFNPAHFKDGNLNLPVERVSWYDAVAFCNALSSMDGLEQAYILEQEKGKPGSESFSFEVRWEREANGWRLPTEAEWEYACRAGSTQVQYGGLEMIAWYHQNSDSSTHEVRTKRPNAWGLHDTLGNVWEWCFDLYDAYGEKDTVDPLCCTGTYRVGRGGSWDFNPGYCRASFRGGVAGEERFNVLGFRPVKG